jgi:signal transduction histidine kinase/CheY-like chemotaxis protein
MILARVAGKIRTQGDSIMPAASLGQDQMEFNPLTLSFPGKLEEVFLESYYRNSLSMVRFSLLMGILLYSFFGILDALLVPQMRETLWLIRFAMVCPALLTVILFSYSPWFKKYFQLSVSLVMIVAGLGIIVMISMIPPPVNYSYYAGMILVFIWGYAFTRVRFIWATAAGWIIVASYEVAATWITFTPFPVLLSNNFFFISANLVGMFSCYSIEYYTRRGFFLAYLLGKEQEKIMSANRTLEKIIEERTAQLLETNSSLRLEIEERQRAEETRAELEKRLQIAQKMEAMGTLAGGIAHDFNNLLMGIQGYTSLMLLDTHPSQPQHEKMKNIEQYVLKGADLTKQLLGFARGGKYEVQATNMNEMVQKSSRLFGRTKKEISIHTQFHSEIWTVEVDQGQIEQVLLNLYVNAWQAMPGGGELYLETENAYWNEPQSQPYHINPGKYVRLTVKDTGVGMDDKTRDRIFEPFFTTKEMGRGTGLGLASAYGIIKSQGGLINVSSKKGQGTTFTIFLPASDKEAAGQGGACSPGSLIGGGENILLVDDEDMIRVVASEMLQRLGYSILVARSGEEAINQLTIHREEVDLVILDLIMPGMSGSETFDHLKAIRSDIRVLLSSGYSVSGEATKIINRGCEGFIQKPFDINRLSHKIREILDRKALAA